ncbi:MAG: outer capsid protein Hoc [Gammaproteobacteria bacterium]|nr:outer capsid protein Hoc [Gammaproteobacteria bacterium]
MAVDGFIGSGTELRRGDGAGTEVFTLVSNITNITGPNISKDEVDVTNMDSTAREFISALDNPGSISFTMNWDPSNAQQVLVRSDAEGNSAGNWQIVWSDTDSTQVDFSGEVMSFSINTTPDGATTADVEIKISGSLTWS